MSNTPITFTTAASTSNIVPQATVPQSFAMPAVDGSNLDTQVAVTGGCTAYIGFAAGAQVGPNAPGCLVVNGAPSLLLNNPVVFAAAVATGKLLAKCIGGPGDNYGTLMAAAQGAAAAAATQFTAFTSPAGGTITITRGTAVPSTQF